MSKNKYPNLNKIEQLYSNNIKKFGTKAESVGWGTQEKQDLRFLKLLSVVTDSTKPFSVNELGCGYGEFVKYCGRNGYKLSKYDGYDISSEMLKAAREYLKDSSKINLHNNATIGTQAEYTIASGIFNVMFDNNQRDWEEHIKTTIRNMYETSSKGIAFNLLTKYVDYEIEYLYYADPLYFFEFCKKQISQKVVLIHDYELFEWTINLKK